jgi:hypothetical protein
MEIGRFLKRLSRSDFVSFRGKTGIEHPGKVWADKENPRIDVMQSEGIRLPYLLLC